MKSKPTTCPLDGSTTSQPMKEKDLPVKVNRPIKATNPRKLPLSAKVNGKPTPVVYDSHDDPGSHKSEVTPSHTGTNIQRIKRKAPQSKPIASPLPTDILFGRGGESNNHPGNQMYQRFLEARAWEYSGMKGRKVKTNFAWKLVHQLKEDGARFLVRNKDGHGYFEADDDESRKKVSQRLREMALEVREHKMAKQSGVKPETVPTKVMEVRAQAMEARARAMDVREYQRPTVLPPALFLGSSQQERGSKKLNEARPEEHTDISGSEVIPAKDALLSMRHQRPPASQRWLPQVAPVLPIPRGPHSNHNMMLLAACVDVVEEEPMRKDPPGSTDYVS